MDKQQLGIDTAAERLGVSAKTVRRLVKTGQLPAVKVDTPTGFVYRIDADAVELEMAARGQKDIVPVQPEEHLRRVVSEALGQPLAELGIKLSTVQAEWASGVQAFGSVVELREALAVARAEAARIAQERDAAQSRADALQAERDALSASLRRVELELERARQRRTWWQRVTGRGNGADKA